jgi:aminoglycoside N3'-acetyltransferase
MRIEDLPTEAIEAAARRLGVMPGGVLIVHSGYRPIGAVEGGLVPPVGGGRVGE